MGWLSSNWIWILLIAGFFAMHLFGHGHRHGGRRRSANPDIAGGADDGHAGHAAVPAAGGQTGEQRRGRRGC